MAAVALAAGEAVPGESVELLAKPLIPGWLYIFMGNRGWKRVAKKNGVKGELYNRPYVKQCGSSFIINLIQRKICDTL